MSFSISVPDRGAENKLRSLCGAFGPPGPLAACRPFQGSVLIPPISLRFARPYRLLARRKAG